jgi:hypothetical protein
LGAVWLWIPGGLGAGGGASNACLLQGSVPCRFSRLKDVAGAH